MYAKYYVDKKQHFYNKRLSNVGLSLYISNKRDLHVEYVVTQHMLNTWQ